MDYKLEAEIALLHLQHALAALVDDRLDDSMMSLLQATEAMTRTRQYINAAIEQRMNCVAGVFEV